MKLVNRESIPIKQLLLWSAILLVEMLSMFTSFIVFTIHLIMVPTLMLYLKLRFRLFVFVYVSTLFLLSLITAGHGIGLAMLSLFFVPTVVVMGYLYKRQSSARMVITGAALTLIGEVLLLLLLCYWAGLHPIESFKASLSSNYEMLPESLRSVDAKMFSSYLDIFTQMIPFLLLFISVFCATITHGIARRILKKSASPLPGLPPMRLWQLPKSVIWYFIIILGVSLFLDGKSDAFIHMAELNLIPLFLMLFCIQAVGLWHDITYYKNWRRGLTITIVVLAVFITLFIPYLLYIVVLLGFLDRVLPIRQWIRGVR